MSLSTLERVALELDFPESIVRRALRKYSFYSAGEFVDYLEEHECEFEVESEDEKEEGIPEEKNIIIAQFPTEDLNKVEKPELSLREETEALQRQSLCLVCQIQKRSFVCLPCSHFALCRRCEPSSQYCPLRSCGEKISCTIQTYEL